MNGTKRGQESCRNNCTQIKYSSEKWFVYCPSDETRGMINVACEVKCSLTAHKYNSEKWHVYCPSAETRGMINVASEVKCSLTKHKLSTIVKSGIYIALQLKHVV